MTKADLIIKLAERQDLTDAQAARIVNLIFDGFKDVLAKGDRIEIRGFGSFAVRDYGNYTGRNPKTGEQVDIKPQKSPHFKMGREMKQRINGISKDARDGKQNKPA